MQSKPADATKKADPKPKAGTKRAKKTIKDFLDSDSGGSGDDKDDVYMPATKKMAVQKKPAKKPSAKTTSETVDISDDDDVPATKKAAIKKKPVKKPTASKLVIESGDDDDDAYMPAAKKVAVEKKPVKKPSSKPSSSKVCGVPNPNLLTILTV